MKAFKILGLFLFVLNLIWLILPQVALNIYLKKNFFVDYFQGIPLSWADICFGLLLIIGLMGLEFENNFFLLVFFLLFLVPLRHYSQMIQMYFINNSPIWLLDMLIRGVLHCLLLFYNAIYLSFIFYRQEVLAMRKNTYTKIAIGLFILACLGSTVNTEYFLYTFNPLITPEARWETWQNFFIYILELTLFLLGVLYQKRLALVLALGVFTYYLLGNLLGLAGLLLPFSLLQIIPAIDSLLACLIWAYLLILLINNRYRLIKFIAA